MVTQSNDGTSSCSLPLLHQDLILVKQLLATCMPLTRCCSCACGQPKSFILTGRRSTTASSKVREKCGVKRLLQVAENQLTTLKMKLIHTVVVFLQCIYAVAIGAHQGAKVVEGPIAAVITPIDAPSPSGQDTESEIASFYALEDPEVILHNAIDDIDVADRLKRTMGMLRMGRSSGVNSPELDEEKRSMGMLRMGKRAMGMLRMGRSDKVSASEDLGKRSMGMLRMGRSSAELDNDEQTSKRAMGMLRMGRSFDDEKRSMGMLRMGRSSRDEQALYEKDKKSMSMLRMG